MSTTLDTSWLVHIVPGHVEWNDVTYEEITDTAKNNDEMKLLQYKATSKEVIKSNSCSVLTDTASPDLTSDLIVEEDVYRNVKVISATYRLTTPRGQFYIGPSYIAGKIAAALSGTNCRGRQCAEVPLFDLLLAHGEGIIIEHTDREPEWPRTKPILRVLPERVEAQWVALTQSSIYRGSVRDIRTIDNYSKGIRNLLQGNLCLYCLLMKGIRGREHNKADLAFSQTICIITRS